MKKLIFSFVAALLLATSSQAQFTDLYNFNGTNGANPWGDLTLSGNVLYGMASAGGAYNYGCVFSINTDGTGYIDLFDFNDTNGKYPEGSLTLSGSVLYGMTHNGGANMDGVIFSINTNGSGYTDLHDFNGTNGGFPKGSLTLSGNVLYGMTEGGLNDGNIFSINTNGTAYIDLFDFNATTGISPYGSLTLSGSVLYGMTEIGGLNSVGVIFSINTNGSGYTDLHDFNGTNGSEPSGGSLILSGGVLYGMTTYGGANMDGVIFSINTNGSGYTDLFDFNATNGVYPKGSLILSGNLLYGMMTGGGSYPGNIFSININGNNYKDLHNFNYATGVNPYGSLTLSGNLLYGMTEAGGADGNGVIFKIDTNTIASINELTANSVAINLYPNPNSGKFTISLSKALNNAEVEIYNIMGEQVYKGTLTPNTTQIDISNEPAGVYLYRVLTENGQLISNGKVIIQ